MSSKLFVGNLRFDATREELEAIFSQAGSVSNIAIPIERETGRPRGFAFVEYSSEEEAKAAVEKFNGYDLRGRAMRVNAAEDRPPRRPGAGGPGGGGGGSFPTRSFGAGGSGQDRGGFPGGGGGYGGDDMGGGFGRDDRFGGGGKNKGSRRNLRARKRSL